MSGAYFYEHINAYEQWQFTQIDVPSSFEPYYHLFTGGAKQRFLLGSHDHTLYWGRISEDYNNVDFFRPNKLWLRQQMPINPITSANIESFKQANPSNSARYWANFFAKALINTPASFLHQGHWRITSPFNPESMQEAESNLVKLTPRYYWSFLHQECDYTFEYPRESHIRIDWNQSPNTPLPLKPLPCAHDGRVKWWRKKIREKACPPLLLWWQSSMLSHIVIDGHSRWCAHLLEKTIPDVLIVSAYQTTNYDHLDTPEKRLRNLQALKQYVNNSAQHVTPTSMSHINQMLMNAYPNTTKHEAVTIGKPIENLDKRWLSEINTLFNSHDFDRNNT